MVMRKGENLSLAALQGKMLNDIEFCREGWTVAGRVPCGGLETTEDRRAILYWKGFPVLKSSSNYLLWEAMKGGEPRIAVIKERDNMMFV